MPCRLRAEEVVTIRVLAEKGTSHCQIGRTLGVSEGTVRYHLRRAAVGAEDGRRRQPRRAEALTEVIPSTSRIPGHRSLAGLGQAFPKCTPPIWAVPEVSVSPGPLPKRQPRPLGAIPEESDSSSS
jgi:hypothetical protein